MSLPLVKKDKPRRGLLVFSEKLDDIKLKRKYYDMLLLLLREQDNHKLLYVYPRNVFGMAAAEAGIDLDMDVVMVIPNRSWVPKNDLLANLYRQNIGAVDFRIDKDARTHRMYKSIGNISGLVLETWFMEDGFPINSPIKYHLLNEWNRLQMEDQWKYTP